MTVIDDITREARENSERWFPAIHDPETQTIDLGLFYSLGLAGEVGEVCNLIKKGLRKGRMPGPELCDELADVFIYLLLLADEVGVGLEAAYRVKRDFNESRWGTIKEASEADEADIATSMEKSGMSDGWPPVGSTGGDE